MVNENEFNIYLNKSINNYRESQKQYSKIQLLVPKNLKKDLTNLIKEFSEKHNNCVII